MKMFIYANPTLLWVLVTATYLWIHREVVERLHRPPDRAGRRWRKLRLGPRGVYLQACFYKVRMLRNWWLVLPRTSPDVTQGPTLVSRARGRV